jgi:hypothetical protein
MYEFAESNDVRDESPTNNTERTAPSGYGTDDPATTDLREDEIVATTDTSGVPHDPTMPSDRLS